MLYSFNMHAFLTIAVIHLLGLISPGPDFAIIVKQSIGQTRRNVIWTALGLGCGMALHTTYCLLGIGLLISQSILLFNTIKYVGAIYLLYIGWKSLTAKKSVTKIEAKTEEMTMTAVKALRIGFLCNALNPKATLFMLALFTQVINPATPLAVQAFYGLYIAFATFLWFSTLGSILTTNVIRQSIDSIHIWAERTMGVVLIALGLKVAFSTKQ